MTQFGEQMHPNQQKLKKCRICVPTLLFLLILHFFCDLILQLAKWPPSRFWDTTSGLTAEFRLNTRKTPHQTAWLTERLSCGRHACDNRQANWRNRGRDKKVREGVGEGRGEAGERRNGREGNGGGGSHRDPFHYPPLPCAPPLLSPPLSPCLLSSALPLLSLHRPRPPFPETPFSLPPPPFPSNHIPSPRCSTAFPCPLRARRRALRHGTCASTRASTCARSVSTRVDARRSC